MTKITVQIKHLKLLMETYMLLINNHKYDRSIKCIIYMPKYKFIEFTYHKSEKMKMRLYIYHMSNFKLLLKILKINNIFYQTVKIAKYAYK